jgi:hypothetical protein
MYPRPHFPPKPKRLPARKRMTLVNGFRCRTGGVLLCADREEDDGYNKREVDKIIRIPCTLLQTCDIFLTAAGNSDLMKRFEAMLIKSLVAALANKKKKVDIFAEHQTLLENELAAFYQREGATAIKKAGGLVYIIVVAPFSSAQCPMMYRSNKTKLIPEPFYCSAGTGQPIADYFADRLFHYDRMDKGALALLAAFILREAEASASGVGLGNDMVFIHDKGNELHFIHKDKVIELQSGIPKLEDSLLSHWTQHATIPAWINTDAKPSDSQT